jgi:hypothetical protein
MARFNGLAEPKHQEQSHMDERIWQSIHYLAISKVVLTCLSDVSKYHTVPITYLKTKTNESFYKKKSILG